MSRKDYRKLAAVLAVNDPVSEGQARVAWRRQAMDMADVLERDNPRFKRELFLTAAGVTRPMSAYPR